MKNCVMCIVMLVTAVLAAGPATAADDLLAMLTAPQTDTKVVTHGETDAMLKAEVVSLHEQLVARQVTGATPLQVTIPAEDAARIGGPVPTTGRLLVGTALPVGQAIDLGKRGAFGAMRAHRDGGFVWSGVVEAPGASAVRLHITGFDLPAGAALYVYGDNGQAAGPYMNRGPLGTGELYTHSIFGDTIRVQLFQDGEPSRLPEGLVLESVGYMGPRFLKALIPTPDQAPLALNPAAPFLDNALLCSYNESCVENAACVSSNVVSDARQAVAGMLYQSGGSYYICTGGLLNDTAGSGTPYFLTANHCLSRGREAASLETYFDYITTCSSPNCTQPYNNTGDTVGATILSTSSSTDHTLLQLSSTPTTADGTLAYMGWTTADVASSNGTNLYRVSHPSGAPQAYSEHLVNTGAGTCSTLPRGNFIYSTDLFGATEGGSSGSPVINGSGQVVGQLFGGCGTNVNDVCDAASNATVDGAFASYYSSVSQWLDPGSGGGGGPTCGNPGASCSSNGDCCSNKCRGPGGNKTCR